MKLDSKKKLAAKALKVGMARIKFNINRLEEIKEAITKQDIKDLKESGAIIIKEIKGRMKNEGRKRRRKDGKVKIKVNKRKQDYVKITRKLREYLKELKLQDKINTAKYKQLRKRIRMSEFRSKKHLKEHIQ